jgi:cytochrome b subunit of formate dehydrogenase
MRLVDVYRCGTKVLIWALLLSSITVFITACALFSVESTSVARFTVAVISVSSSLIVQKIALVQLITVLSQTRYQSLAFVLEALFR